MKKTKKADRARFFTRSAKIRSVEKDGKKYIVGTIPYNSRSVDLGFDCYEILSPGVFSETLKNGENVYALRNHNSDEILASTQAGTLTLEDTETGLICTAELPATTYANDLFTIVQRGDCTTLSFGFVPNSVQYTDLDDGTSERTIIEASLEEVSFGVPFPAYPESDVQAEMRNRKRARRAKREEEIEDEEERDDELDDEEERDDEIDEEEERDDEIEDEEERDDEEIDEEERDDEEIDEEERDDEEIDEEERDDEEIDDEERDDEEIEEEERDDEIEEEEERDDEEIEDEEEERKRRARRRRRTREREAEAFLFLNRYK